MPGTRLVAGMLVLVALVWAVPRLAAAAVLTVTDCGDTTPGGAPGQLRRLITDAAPGDTIVIPGCIITLTGTAGEDANAGGDLDITKNLTIHGAGAHATVIDGGLIDRIFDVINPVVHPPLPPPITVTITDLMIRNGRGNTRGGGLRNSGNLTLQRVVVRSNVVLAGTLEAGGGGIANEGTLAAQQITVEGNGASGPVVQSGGGIHNVGTLTLTRSTVSGNRVVAAEFFSNSGGIANSGTLTVVESTISGNDGGRDGPGGILNVGNLTVIASAVVSNTSVDTADGIKSSGPASLTNAIIANNKGNQCDGVFTSVGGNLATDATCGLNGPSDAVVANAGLGPLGTQGGPTPTHPLLPGSPAIDTAIPALCDATDQRGMPRPQDGNGDGTAICDKGPFEFTPPVFADVPVTHFARGAIEALRQNGITGGCGTAPLIFCPDDVVTRAQLAVFLLRTLHGGGFIPPPAVGLFADVPVSNPFAPWIERLYIEGITGGCGLSPLRYCPADPVTRGQLSILILRTLSMPGFVPPAAVGLFVDVPVGDPFAPWVEEFFRRGMTSGCQANPPAFCPGDAATRAQIAAFLVRGFGFGF